MAYPDGTIFDSPQNFPPYSQFGDGCVFESGCTFENPCTFGEGCVFAPGCSLLRTDPRLPPHQTGNGCVFGEGCNIEYTIIGTANVIGKPGTFSPVSVGANTVVGPGNNRNLTCEVSSTVSANTGQIVSDCKVSTDWKDASNPAGFDGQDHLHINDTEWDIHT